MKKIDLVLKHFCTNQRKFFKSVFKMKENCKHFEKVQ